MSGVVIYNAWRLADVLPEATVAREVVADAPAIAAGELADWLAIHLRAKPDQ